MRPEENLKNVIAESIRFLTENERLGFRDLREFLGLDEGEEWLTIKRLVATKWLNVNFN